MQEPSPLQTAKDNYRWEVLGIVMMGTLMAALDSSIVNISLPNMMADFGTTVDNIEWVTTGYMLAYAVFITMAAWVKARLGSRQLFLSALVVFTVGSLLCGMAWNLPALIVARVLQALGGGFITPIGMSMVAEVFSPKERGKAMGIWGMGVIVGPALGPALGGYLTKTFGWRSIFLVNLPVGLLALLLGMALLRKDVIKTSDHKPFDLWGFAFLALFLVSFLLGVSQGEKDGWTSPFIVTCWILAALGLIFFLVVESGESYGIIDLSMFKSRAFTACVLVTVGRPIALFGATFLLPLFIQTLMGRDEFQSGLIMLPGSLLLALCMPVAGKLADSTGPRWLVLAGALGIAFFMYQYRTLDVNSSTWDVVWPTLVRGAAISLMVAPVMATALNSVPTSKSAQASSMLNLVQQVAGSAGITVLATYMNHRQHFHLADLAGRIASRASENPALAAPLAHRALDLGYSHAQAWSIASLSVAGQAGRAAAVRAFDDAFLFGALIVVATACIPALMLPTRNTSHHGLEVDAMAVE